VDAADFQRIFNAIPAQYAAYDLDWNIVAITDPMLASLGRSREEVVGRNQFDVFPDNPDDPDASGNATMLGAFERVLAEKTGHVLPVTRYDIADEDGIFRERYWKPVNEPVFGDDGTIRYVIHGVEDVTASVLESQAGGAR
jgi:PAS domain S-box-containing protein